MNKNEPFYKMVGNDTTQNYTMANIGNLFSNDGLRLFELLLTTEFTVVTDYSY